MNKLVEIIGAPSTYGQKIGVDFGPDAIRYAGIVERIQNIGINVKDSGNISVPAIHLEKFNSAQKDYAI